jgi:hypothetical protein
MDLTVAVYRQPDDAETVDPDLRGAVQRRGVLRAVADRSVRLDPERATLVATSTPTGATEAGELTTERLTADLQRGEHFLVVRRASGSTTPRPTPTPTPSARSDATGTGQTGPAGDGRSTPRVTFELSSPTHDLAVPRPAGSVTAPSTAPEVIAVGAAGADGVTRYSSRGPTVDGRLGVDVVAPTDQWPQAARVDGRGGTSAATAYVGGVAALMRAAAPGLSAPRIRTALRTTAHDVGPPGPDATAGYGRVDAGAAVRRAATLDGRGLGGGSGASGSSGSMPTPTPIRRVAGGETAGPDARPTPERRDVDRPDRLG